jgi:hypothetical protein
MSSFFRSCAPSDWRACVARRVGAWRRELASVAMLPAIALCAAAWACDAAGAPPAPAAPVASPPAGRVPVEPSIVGEHWFRLSLGGTPCGWSREVVRPVEGGLETERESHLELGRMGQRVVIRSRSSFRESGSGEPISAESERITGGAPVRSTWTFGPDGIEVVQEQGGRRSVERVPVPPAGWLAPAAAERMLRALATGGGTEAQWRSMDPDGGPIEVRWVRTRVTPVGRTEPDGTVEWRTEGSLLERPSSEWTGPDGAVRRSRVDLGVGILESVACSAREARAPLGTAEVMARSFIELRQDGAPLAGARSARLRLRASDGGLADLPSGGAQRFDRIDPGSGEVTIDLGASGPADASDASDPRYRAASVMVDSDDPAIRRLATAALEGAPTGTGERAERLRDFTWRHLSRKDLANGLASASEAAASRSGDCTEHAVLLAALLRADGIPARVAFGAVWVPRAGSVRNAYGWHMWTQALVDGSWIDLDATLGGTRFDAARLLTGTSAADGASLDTDLSRVVNMIGDLEIELVEVDGRPVAPIDPVDGAKGKPR